MNRVEALDKYAEVSQTVGGLVETHRRRGCDEQNIRRCDCALADTYRERKTEQRTLRTLLLAPAGVLD